MLMPMKKPRGQELTLEQQLTNQALHHGPALQRSINCAGVKRVALPPRWPNLNAYAERWVRSIQEECLSRLILCGEASLRQALTQYVAHVHHERNHQGKGNVLLFP